MGSYLKKLLYLLQYLEKSKGMKFEIWKAWKEYYDLLLVFG